MTFSFVLLFLKTSIMTVKPENKISRGRFLTYVLTSILSIEGVFLLFKSSGRKNKSKANSQLHDAGTIESFDNNGIYPFTSGQFNLIRYTDGGFMALSTKCTHLSCIININNEKSGFECPCHSSKFDLFGQVDASPATRPLDTFPIIFKEDHVWVDIAQPIKRQKFEREQLYYS